MTTSGSTRTFGGLLRLLLCWMIIIIVTILRLLLRLRSALVTNAIPTNQRTASETSIRWTHLLLSVAVLRRY